MTILKYGASMRLHKPGEMVLMVLSWNQKAVDSPILTIRVRFLNSTRASR